MAFVPPQLADIQTIMSLVSYPAAKPTAYFHRWLQDNNARITKSFEGLAEVIAELETQQQELEDLQQELTDQVNQIYLDFTFEDVQLQNQIDSLATFTVRAVGVYTGGALAGIVQIPHGLGFVPTMNYSAAQIVGTSPVVINLLAVDIDYLYVYLMDFTGTPISGGSYDIRWQVGFSP